MRPRRGAIERGAVFLDGQNEHAADVGDPGIRRAPMRCFVSPIAQH
jgi:hypothetical protein